jgi:hypothetical protein
MALLDWFFYSLSWNTHFLHTIVISLPKFLSDYTPLILCINKKQSQSLPRFLSDYTPLILCINKQQSQSVSIVRFEKKWLVQSGFMDLIIKLWSEHHLIHDFGNEWRLKLQHMRKKIRG